MMDLLTSFVRLIVYQHHPRRLTVPIAQLANEVALDIGSSITPASLSALQYPTFTDRKDLDAHYS